MGSFHFRHFVWILVILGMSFSISCDMFDMPGTTKEMNATTKELDKKTAEMNSTTQELDKKTDRVVRNLDEVLHDSRIGETLDKRMKIWQQLIEAKTTPSMPDKIALAAAYMKAFEFQLIRELEINDEVIKNFLYKDAVNEFLRRVQSYLPKKRSATSLGMEMLTPNDSNANMITKALSVTLREVNHKQEELEIKDPTHEATELMDLLERGLFPEAGRGATEDDWEYGVQLWEKSVIYLMNVRQNTLQVMALNLMADEHIKGLVLYWFFGIKVHDNWEPQFKVINDTAVSEAHRYLKEAVKNRKFIDQPNRGWNVIQDELLKEAFEKMKPIHSLSLTDSPRDQKIREIGEFIDEIIK